MPKLLCAMILVASCAAFGGAQTQTAAPAADKHGPAPGTGAADSPFPVEASGSKVGLVRGVVKQMDPIHDQLLILAFGGGDVRIAFDPRTQLLSENKTTRFTSVPAGSVVSVDTVIEGGKLFALSVRTGPSEMAELRGQVVRYDAAKSQLTVRDPINPGKTVSLGIAPSTMLVNQGQRVSPQVLSSGTLVHVWFSPGQSAASHVEILAVPGTSFLFEGRIIGVDLRSRSLVLSNNSDHTIRELTLGSLDATSLSLLREGTDVSVQAEFDGDRYNVRSVTPVSTNP